MWLTCIAGGRRHVDVTRKEDVDPGWRSRCTNDGEDVDVTGAESGTNEARLHCLLAER